MVLHMSGCSLPYEGGSGSSKGKGGSAKKGDPPMSGWKLLPGAQVTWELGAAEGPIPSLALCRPSCWPGRGKGLKSSLIPRCLLLIANAVLPICGLEI